MTGLWRFRIHSVTIIVKACAQATHIYQLGQKDHYVSRRLTCLGPIHILLSTHIEPVDQPRHYNYVDFPGSRHRTYIAPRCGAYAPKHRDKVPGSKRNPRVKTYIPRADRAGNRNVTGFMRVGIESLQITYDSWVYMISGQLVCFSGWL
jgi:hypothetical protein